ncbi:hypothetical protein ACFS5N_06195 [Mucilaginibacter ximonensis]|uniref:CopG family transcriptional regulator n=1 Tax=Mucilaginibacter ximonensis TaxID=538021 RepID=A0ABW5Y9J8_9SPHI
MTNYKDKLGGLADKLKTAPVQPPIQKVQPIKAPASERATDVQFNTEIPKSLRKQLKAHSNEHDLSLKDITITALKLYLETYPKNQEHTIKQ